MMLKLISIKRDTVSFLADIAMAGANLNGLRVSISSLGRFL